MKTDRTIIIHQRDKLFGEIELFDDGVILSACEHACNDLSRLCVCGWLVGWSGWSG